MIYEIVLKKEADEELGNLSHNQKIMIFKQLNKLKISPQLSCSHRPRWEQILKLRSSKSIFKYAFQSWNFWINLLDLKVLQATY